MGVLAQLVGTALKNAAVAERHGALYSHLLTLSSQVSRAVRCGKRVASRAGGGAALAPTSS